MSTYYLARNTNGEHIFDNFPTDLYQLINDYKDNFQVISVTIDNKLTDARLGKKSNSFGEVYILTTEEKYVRRIKLFRELVDMSILSLGPLTKFQKSINDEQCSKTDELIHNITSLNTYSIQDLFALIPQKTLSENINAQKDIIKSVITSKPNVTIDTLLKLIKYNLAMKVEFSVFERTQKPNATIKKISHSIRGLVLSILQIFIDDFEKLKIEVSLDAGAASERRLEIDDDSLFVSLFYLLENSLKYCCPNTKYKIIFKDEQDYFSILFIMISIRIEDNEVKKLTEYGYRSETAKSINADGKGIGMHRITKTLKLNNAELEITPRINDYTRQNGKVTYEGNQFKIKFNGQQDWFKKN
ncbi:MAG: hypothetical protein HUU48_09135 [Flavobacteriales bacterium]|nr:hypothetical protein [Flavobacteriales bacterium]